MTKKKRKSRRKYDSSYLLEPSTLSRFNLGEAVIIKDMHREHIDMAQTTILNMQYGHWLDPVVGLFYQGWLYETTIAGPYEKGCWIESALLSLPKDEPTAWGNCIFQPNQGEAR